MPVGTKFRQHVQPFTNLEVLKVFKGQSWLGLLICMVQDIQNSQSLKQLISGGLHSSLYTRTFYAVKTETDCLGRVSLSPKRFH